MDMMMYINMLKLTLKQYWNNGDIKVFFFFEGRYENLI